MSGSMIDSPNPLQAGIEAGIAIKVENLSDCKPISAAELTSLMGLLNKIEDNIGLLRMIEFQKQPYLFSSSQLLEILTSTTSVKTRIAIIQSIGPRLLDPQAKKDELMGLFRYAEEKLKVEDVLKNAWQRVSQQTHVVGSGANLLGSKGGRGGAGLGVGGGRGLGGRGTPKSISNRDKISEKSVSEAEDVALLSPAASEMAPKLGSDSLSDEHDQPKSPPPTGGADVTPKKKSLIINKRPVTVKLAADLAHEKYEAEILAASTPNVNVPKSTVTPKQDSVLKRSKSAATPKTIAQLMQGESDSAVTPQAPRHAHDHENEVVNQEISSVLKLLDMDSSRAEAASSDLEVWEMLVVTNRTVECHLSSRAGQSLTKTKSAPQAEFGHRHEMGAARSMGAKRQSFQFYSGMFSAAKQAYTEAINSLNQHSSEHNNADFDKIVEELSSSFNMPSGITDIDSQNDKYTVQQKFAVTKVSELRNAFNPQAKSSSTDPLVQAEGEVIDGKRSGKLSVSKLYKDAAKPSFALGLDPHEFLAMIEEQPVGVNADGLDQYTYKELVRRNYARNYGGISQTDLELYLNDEEFEVKFGMNKEEFAKLPTWKRVSLKKSLLLF